MFCLWATRRKYNVCTTGWQQKQQDHFYSLTTSYTGLLANNHSFYSGNHCSTKNCPHYNKGICAVIWSIYRLSTLAIWIVNPVLLVTDLSLFSLLCNRDQFLKLDWQHDSAWNKFINSCKCFTSLFTVNLTYCITIDLSSVSLEEGPASSQQLLSPDVYCISPSAVKETLFVSKTRWLKVQFFSLYLY